jgi:hypothetical protein
MGCYHDEVTPDCTFVPYGSEQVRSWIQSRAPAENQ